MDPSEYISCEESFLQVVSTCGPSCLSFSLLQLHKPFSPGSLPCNSSHFALYLFNRFPSSSSGQLVLPFFSFSRSKSSSLLHPLAMISSPNAALIWPTVWYGLTRSVLNPVVWTFRSQGGSFLAILHTGPPLRQTLISQAMEPSVLHIPWWATTKDRFPRKPVSY